MVQFFMFICPLFSRNFIARVIVVGILFVGWVDSAAAQSKCFDIFSISTPLAGQRASLEKQILNSKDHQLQSDLSQQLLLDAARRARELNMPSMAFSLEAYVYKVLTTDSVKGFPQYLREGSTEVYVVTFSSGLNAIFKPDPQYWVVDSKKENAYLSNSAAEIATYRLSKIFGLDVVPVTVKRTIDGKTGSLQAFVRGSKSIIESFGILPETAKQQAIDLNIFDFLIRNGDRNGFNVLVNSTYLWAIDNGSTFHHEKIRIMAPNMKTIFLDRMSLAFLANLRATTPLILREILKDYPDKVAVEELILRYAEILRATSDRAISEK